MIRDPSDGTVKEPPVLNVEISGLPIGKAKAEYLARLEASRAWLKEYFSPKPEGESGE